jgi:hypothetical protein
MPLPPSHHVRRNGEMRGGRARTAGVPAQLANEAYVEALARVVYYWGYPAVDSFGRTKWQIFSGRNRQFPLGR